MGPVSTKDLVSYFPQGGQYPLVYFVVSTKRHETQRGRIRGCIDIQSTGLWKNMESLQSESMDCEDTELGAGTVGLSYRR